MLKRQFKRSEGKDKPLQVKIVRPPKPTPVVKLRKCHGKPVKYPNAPSADSMPYPGRLCLKPRRLFRTMHYSLNRCESLSSIDLDEAAISSHPYGVAMDIDCESDTEGRATHNEQGEELFCICRKPYDPSTFMIGCDECNDWFHGTCVRIPVNIAKTLEKYVCPRCVKRSSQVGKRAFAVTPQTPSTKEQESSSRPGLMSATAPVIASDSPQTATHPNDCSASIPSSGERHESDSFHSSPSQIHSPPHEFSSLSVPLEPAITQRTSTCSNPDCTALTKDFASKFCSEVCAVAVTKNNLKRRQALMSPTTGPSQLPTSTLPTARQVAPRTEFQKQQEAVRADLFALEAQIRLLETALSARSSTDTTCGYPLLETPCQAPAATCLSHTGWSTLKLPALLEEKMLKERALHRLQIEENLVQSTVGA